MNQPKDTQQPKTNNTLPKNESAVFRQDPENKKQDDQLRKALKEVSKNPPETI